MHTAMALFLALWSAVITAFVLRRALSFGEIDGNDHKDDKTVGSSSIPQADQGTHSCTKIPRDSKEEHMNTKDAASGIKKAPLSESSMAIVESSEEVASSLTKKAYVSEIGKVINTMQEHVYMLVYYLFFPYLFFEIENQSTKHVSCKHLSCNVFKGYVHHCICKL